MERLFVGIVARVVLAGLTTGLALIAVAFLASGAP